MVGGPTRGGRMVDAKLGEFTLGQPMQRCAKRQGAENCDSPNWAARCAASIAVVAHTRHSMPVAGSSPWLVLSQVRAHWMPSLASRGIARLQPEQIP